MRSGARAPKAVAWTLFAALLIAAIAVPVVASAETPDVGNDVPTALAWPMLPIATPSFDNLPGTLDPATDADDCYKVYLTAGQAFYGELVVDPGCDFRLGLLSPEATSTAWPGGSMPISEMDSIGTNKWAIFYPVTRTGYYYLDVKLYSGWNVSNPTVSPAGGYSVYADQFPMPYEFEKFTVPSKAKHGSWFKAYVHLTPAYIGSTYRPVTMCAQKLKGKKVVSTVKVGLHGSATADYTSYVAKFKLSKGTWRMWTQFKDSDHKLMKTKFKTVKVK